MRQKLVENATVAALGVGVLIGAGTLRGAGYPGWSIPFFVLGAAIILFAVADLAIEGLKPPLSWSWGQARRIRVGLAPLDGSWKNSQTVAVAPAEDGLTVRANAAPIDALMAEMEKRPTVSDGLHWRPKGWYTFRNGERERWIEARCIQHELPIVEVAPDGSVHQQTRTMSTKYGNRLYCPGSPKRELGALEQIAGVPEGGMHEVKLTESSSWEAAVQLAIARIG